MAERRDEARAPIEVEVQYRTVQEFLAAYSRNISGGGIFIRTAQPQPLNQAIMLRFTLPGIAHRFEINGMVVWVNTSSRSSFPVGMGIKFMQMPQKDADLIAEFVKKAVAAQAPAGSEGGGAAKKG
jgi:type IV pilus assembly protein PilZ